ncbi:caspase family protein [Rhizobium laguerreae]|uniref:caspase family protein n=1 Tax=Rhizobium laguerreae TaxID=1076926 RepID=UPI001C911627|nr:caspase family protein [Rhizobium laguerreae]MBY3347973.1 peptidase C14, caspase catalytic subunit p20 [Rhizobium laguerreae]MBY3354936.1 peptidase C14, caspase catalytic subunit p20 [Rhizobium laguerreae]MBY3376241.1 peptidase C14, caspase catalytic subunit p20 [Rhizobium laguerreae]MBY3431240.1 peptidase C14, caspase catalytic subunit p20 [Rhizobium laguerreae]MBY3439856.1 peptidase C14, caspase catalytic subunit p20 [Rhizobium laguerreae]
MLGIFLLLSVAGATNASDKRLALVIGNSDYTMFRGLPAAANDAVDISEALAGLGFSVVGGRDLDHVQMVSAVNEFARQSAEADVALVYYAGHGLQVDGVNYLIPVDVTIDSVDDLGAATVSLDAVMRALSETNAVRLIFLDACRNNPIPDDMIKGRRRGLAPINAAGFLVAYSTQPENVALDGAGRNSPFAEALLNHIGQAGQDIASLMISVRRDVIAATGGFQIPWENSSLTKEFYFVDGDRDYMSAEATLFRLAGKHRDPGIMAAYLQKYPKGAYVADVRALQSNSADAAGDEESEELIWNVGRSQRIKALVDLYLKRFPSGKHRADAEQLQAVLSREETPDTSPGVVCESLATHPRDATASMPGVTLPELASNAERAIRACEAAMQQFPDSPHYVALLARSLAAEGKMAEAVVQYKIAVARGDLRALVTLGLMMQMGDGVPRDPVGAAKLYERAANGGSPDGAINLAVMLADGQLIDKNVPKAVAILIAAADKGSALASFNLGVLAGRGTPGISVPAADYFRRATQLGDPRGFMPLAILLDEGRTVSKDPIAAADALLRGTAADSGDTVAHLLKEFQQWSVATRKEIQVRLSAAGYYNGPIDAKMGPSVREALQKWRLYGPPA